MERKKVIFFSMLLAITIASCATSSDKKKTLDQVETSDWHYKMAAGYFNSHEIQLATRELTLSLKKDPKNADAHHLLGIIYMGRGQYEKAYKELDAAVNLRENFFSAINNRGTVLLYLGKWEEAKKEFERLIDEPLYTTPTLAYLNLGWANYNLQEYQEALHNFQKSIENEPKNCKAYNNLGMTQEALSMINEAANSYSVAIKKCGDVYAEPHMHLGKLYAASGNPAAIEEFKKCIEINPEAYIAGKCREYLRAITRN